MGVKQWWARFRTSDRERRDAIEQKTPLREFVYLDEVSLISLLSSQTGELKSEVSDATSYAEEAQLAGTASANITVLKAEANSRYQTSNSQTTQTTRKVNVQSLFRDFRAIASDRLVLRTSAGPPEIKNSRTREDVLSDSRLCIGADELKRGRVIELVVELDTDPIFKVSTMMSEIVDMSVEYPEMLGSSSLPPETAQIAKVLQRMMTGLIPIRGRCVDHAVVENAGESYIVHTNTAQHLGMAGKPLTLVGVTEHLGYWKDIRRVLFSGSQFTILCRLGRDGVQDDWTPVKLADMFKDVVPQMADVISQAGLLSERMLAVKPSPPVDARLDEALRLYGQRLITDHNLRPSPSAIERMEAAIALGSTGADKLDDQLQAFEAVASILEVELTPADDLERRREARRATGLRLFSESSTSHPTSDVSPAGESPAADALLDIEVIAIYW